VSPSWNEDSPRSATRRGDPRGEGVSSEGRRLRVFYPAIWPAESRVGDFQVDTLQDDMGSWLADGDFIEDVKRSV
jgi:hypothetical protein